MRISSAVAACLLVLTLFCASCSSPQPAATPAGPPPADVSGLWKGDWGPSARDRNDVALQLNFQGGVLSGVVNPGSNAINLSKAAYEPASGEIKLEADAQGRGRVVHYVIEGKAAGLPVNKRIATVRDAVRLPP
jgi:hypothetical protein